MQRILTANVFNSADALPAAQVLREDRTFDDVRHPAPQTTPAHLQFEIERIPFRSN